MKVGASLLLRVSGKVSGALLLGTLFPGCVQARRFLRHGSWPWSGFDIRYSSSLTPRKRSHLSPGHFHSLQCSVVFSWRSEEQGFVPEAEFVTWRVPKGATVVVEQTAPKPFPPRSALFHRADAGNGRAAQLAGFRQGRVGRSAGGIIQ